MKGLLLGLERAEGLGGRKISKKEQQCETCWLLRQSTRTRSWSREVRRDGSPARPARCEEERTSGRVFMHFHRLSPARDYQLSHRRMLDEASSDTRSTTGPLDVSAAIRLVAVLRLACIRFNFQFEKGCEHFGVCRLQPSLVQGSKRNYGV